jgi:hypothetical protein
MPGLCYLKEAAGMMGLEIVVIFSPVKNWLHSNEDLYTMRKNKS